MANKYLGCVDWFDKKKGYGFILNMDDENNPIFVHHSYLKPSTDCYSFLEFGEYVEFEISEGKNGKQAENVTGVKGGDLKCDTIHKNRNRKKSRKNTEKNEKINKTDQ